MVKSKAFIIIGIFFLLIALIIFAQNNSAEKMYNVMGNGPYEVALSGYYVRNLLISFFIGQTGTLLLIFGIRDQKKLQ